MKLQRYDHPWCGPAALQNALRALGLFIRQEELVHLCGTTEDGTDEKGLIKALNRLPVDFYPIYDFKRLSALSSLDASLSCGEPVIICVDDWDHWVVVIGKLGTRYLIFDSTNDSWNREEQGCWSVDADTLIKKWRCSDEHADGEAPFYGITVCS